MKIILKISFGVLTAVMLVIFYVHTGMSFENNDTSNDQIRIYSENGDTVTFKLKNGGEVTGRITEYTDEGLTVDIGFGTAVIAKSDIKTIVPSKTLEKEQWEEHSTVEDPKTRENRLEKEEAAFFTRIEEAERLQQEAEKSRNMVTTIRFQDSSRIIVDAILNGKKTRLLVDTGATLVSISPKTARMLGISVKNKKTVSAELADGRLGQIVPITLKTVQVGNATAENVEAGIIITASGGHTQRSGADGLLGMSFLNNFHMTIDAKKKVLTLIKK